jgi:hypothetical protein
MNSAVPSGRPVCVHCRMAVISDSVPPAVRYFCQLETSQCRCHISISKQPSAASVPQWAAALDQIQDSASVTNPARTGLSSVYRNASQRCDWSRGQPIGFVGDHDHVNMIGHEAVANQRHTVELSILSQQIEIDHAISVGVQDKSSPIPTLCDMVRYINGNDPSQACHASDIIRKRSVCPQVSGFSQVSPQVSPGFSQVSPGFLSPGFPRQGVVSTLHGFVPLLGARMQLIRRVIPPDLAARGAAKLGLRAHLPAQRRRN